MIRPPFLKTGDQVGIVAPAKKVSRQEMEMAIQILEGWGLEVVLGKHLFSTHNQFAGTDTERTEDLQNMLDNPDIRVIFSARGGYGTIRVVDKLKFNQFIRYPKWLVGFSDITVLHCHLHNMGVKSIHGIMPLLFPKQTEQTIESLRKALFGEALEIHTLRHPLNRYGENEGRLIGGNLSLFANTIGTISEVSTEGKLLFLEDVNEYLYHIDRMMIHLYRAGKLRNLEGLIIGQFTQIKDNEISFGKTVHEIIAEIVSEYSYPVCFDFPVGHEIHNMTMICGNRGRLLVDQFGVKLTFL
ncbi:MAG: LD-carboxypeptidase [Microscillaceae bacterium]|nr:LD-carboxypeptidase [Microscillaceae bacterium]